MNPKQKPPPHAKPPPGPGGTKKAPFDPMTLFGPAFTDSLVDDFAVWRGYSDPFCDWLRATRKVGYYIDQYGIGHFCYPIYSTGGVIIGAQVFAPNAAPGHRVWTVGEVSGNMTPVVLGNVAHAHVVVSSESAHDACHYETL